MALGAQSEHDEFDLVEFYATAGRLQAGCPSGVRNTRAGAPANVDAPTPCDAAEPTVETPETRGRTV